MCSIRVFSLSAVAMTAAVAFLMSASTRLCAQPVNEPSEPATVREVSPRERHAGIALADRLISLETLEVPWRLAVSLAVEQAGGELRIDGVALATAGMDIDRPVTVRFQDEPLSEVMVRLLGDFAPELGFVHWKAVDDRVVISTIQADQARAAALIPPDLLPLHNKGMLVNLDFDGNVAQFYGGRIVTNELLHRLGELAQSDPKWAHLSFVNIEVTKGITPEGLEALTKLPRLTTLQLYNVNTDGGAALGNDALRIATKIPSLRVLSLDVCVTDEGLKSAVELRQLTSLSIAKNGITDAGLAHLSGLTNLQELDLNSIVSTDRFGRNNITDAGLQKLAGLKELRRLDLTGMEVSGAFLDFPKLQYLNVSGPRIDDAALRQIARSRDLRYLYLGGNITATNVGMEAISQLPELRRISLNGPAFDDRTLELLKSLPKLESVEMSRYRISDAGMKALSEMPNLRRIDISFGAPPVGTRLTPAGVAQLKALTKLRELWLINYRADEYAHLAQLQQLRTLVLDMTAMKQEQYNRLEELMPQASISAGTGGGFLRSIRQDGPRF